MVMSPCLDCPERHQACHDECEAYQEYKREREKELDALRAFKKEHNTKKSERKFGKAKGQL